MPYPDIALAPTAIPNAFNILFTGTPAHNMATVTPLTNGDNPSGGHRRRFRDGDGAVPPP